MPSPGIMVTVCRPPYFADGGIVCCEKLLRGASWEPRTSQGRQRRAGLSAAFTAPPAAVATFFRTAFRGRLDRLLDTLRALPEPLRRVGEAALPHLELPPGSLRSALPRMSRALPPRPAWLW